MERSKVIFIAFAIEDENARNLFTGQSRLGKSPFSFIDMSVREAYVDGWKDKVRTRIRRSDGVIVLISKNSLTSTGQKWEVACAKEERKPVLAMWINSSDRTMVEGLKPVAWSWTSIGAFIDGL